MLGETILKRLSMWFNLFKKSTNNQEWRTKYSSEWRIAKKNALKRDNNRCQNPSCNRKQTKRSRMAIHHIYDASTYKRLRLRMDNLITLCHGKRKCHSRFHSWMGGYDKTCTKKDLKLWFEYEKIRKGKSILAIYINNPYWILSITLLTIIIGTYLGIIKFQP